MILTATETVVEMIAGEIHMSGTYQGSEINGTPVEVSGDFLDEKTLVVRKYRRKQA